MATLQSLKALYPVCGGLSSGAHGVFGEDPHRKLPSSRNSALSALIRLFQLSSNQRREAAPALPQKLRQEGGGSRWSFLCASRFGCSTPPCPARGWVATSSTRARATACPLKSGTGLVSVVGARLGPGAPWAYGAGLGYIAVRALWEGCGAAPWREAAGGGGCLGGLSPEKFSAHHPKGRLAWKDAPRGLGLALLWD